ncbi:MAG: NAD-dependent epimerase/dehydratase family protein [Lachnospiraceae bacterium]|nr:NAD-dependent epimerase/dehydratase family protein [Lachnospiraceae bacterium]
MNILVTGAAGFVGRNLIENLKNIRDGKNKTRPKISIKNIYEYDINNSIDDLDKFCRDCDFVFNLAGVNRPKDVSEFKKGNLRFASVLLDTLKKNKNKCPVMLSSSIQASLAGRFGESEYGKSKLAGEELFFTYSHETGAHVYVYRFPNLAGKWIRPNYNSAVGTFCYAIANDLPYNVTDRNTIIELLFIDDLIEEMYDAIEGHPHKCDYPKKMTVDNKTDLKLDGTTPLPMDNGRYCYVPITHKESLGNIIDYLESFKNLNNTYLIPEIPVGSFVYKLYSMYLSYLPASKMSYSLKMNIDERGIFTEMLKTRNNGQFSINITRPGYTRGQHWHNTKWEIFIVVSGHGLIQQRKIGINPETGKEYDIHEFEVRGEVMKAVIMLPGYAHNIVNLEKDKDLVTVMWANESFDPKHPDTFGEEV